MSFRTTITGLVVLGTVAACADHPAPTSVDEPGPTFAQGAAPVAEQHRLERLARRVAIVLAAGLAVVVDQHQRYRGAIAHTRGRCARGR